jgi:hypothetical protein
VAVSVFKIVLLIVQLKIIIKMVLSWHWIDGGPLPSDHLDNASAKFPTSGTDNQKAAKIALQKWLGLFMMSTEAYLDYRRTRLPAIDQNGDLSMGDYPYPIRFRYPQTEMNNNSKNYQEAIGKLDQGDTELSKMWLLQ